MSKNDSIFLYVGVYDDTVKVHKHEKPTQHGAWTRLHVDLVATQDDIEAAFADATRG